MPSIHSLIGVGRRALTARLDRLHATLQALGSRVQQAVSQAVGDTVGGAVQEALLGALATVDNAVDDYYRPPSPTAEHWEERDRPGWESDSYYEEYREPAQHYAPAYEEPAETPQPARLSVAVASGLRAAAWMLRFWWGQCSSVVAAVVGLGAAALVYLAGPVAETGLGIIESADNLSHLGRAARSRLASRYGRY